MTGKTHKGTATFIAQRTSAVLLLPLVVWFLAGAVATAGSTQEEMRVWLAMPVNALLMGLLIIVGAFHMRIGMNEIIDDYAHGGLRGVWKILNMFLCLGAIGAVILALYSITS